MQEEWILIRADLEMNVKWFIKYRFMGLSMRPELINKEIALSNGNIRRVEVDEERPLFGRHVYLFKNKLSVVIDHVADEIKGMIGYYTESAVLTKTSLDDEIDKLNKRLSLVGSKRQFSTDGVSLVQLINTDELTLKDASTVNICTKMTPFVNKSICSINECVDINVDKLDFLNVRRYKFKGLHFTGHKHLRYLVANARIELYNYDITMGDGVTFEMAESVNILPGNMTKIKRLYNCATKENFIDLSNVDYISHGGLCLDGETGAETHLHFGDKYVMITEHSIFRSTEQDIRITYSNPDMSGVLRKFAHRANGVMGKVKLVYEGR